MSIEFIAIVPGCGCPMFAVPESTYRSWRDTHCGWHCPYCGDGRIYRTGSSDKEKLERQVKRLEGERNRARDSAESERKSANAFRGHLTRQKRRIAKGVCPSCNKHFERLGRHMKSKHPEFADSESQGD